MNKDKPELIKYPNGTHLLSIKDTTYNTTSIYFYIKLGSKYEKKEINGISHFLEHMVFKSNTKYPKPEIMTQIIDSMGVSYNAYTNKSHTAYHYKFPTDLGILKKICDIAYHMLFKSVFKDNDIKVERDVIIQEIKGDLNNPDITFEDKIENNLFAKTPLEFNVAGNLKSINNIKKTDLEEYYNKFYKPENLIIVVSGNLPVGFKKVINNRFSKGPKMENIDLMNKLIPFESPYQGENMKDLRVKLKYKNGMEKTQKHLAIVFLTKGLYDENRLVYRLLANLLGGNMSSRLFLKIRENLGLVYTISSSNILYMETGYFYIKCKLNETNIPKVLKIINNELQDMIKNGITDKELKKSKFYVINNLKMDLNDNDYKSEFYGEQLLNYPEIKTVQKYINQLKRITKKDINSAIKTLFNQPKIIFN